MKTYSDGWIENNKCISVYLRYISVLPVQLQVTNDDGPSQKNRILLSSVPRNVFRLVSVVSETNSVEQ